MLGFDVFAIFFLNLSFAVFNLLPIPGLDGWRIIEEGRTTIDEVIANTKDEEAGAAAFTSRALEETAPGEEVG